MSRAKDLIRYANTIGPRPTERPLTVCEHTFVLSAVAIGLTVWVVGICLSVYYWWYLR